MSHEALELRLGRIVIGGAELEAAANQLNSTLRSYAAPADFPANGRRAWGEGSVKGSLEDCELQVDVLLANEVLREGTAVRIREAVDFARKANGLRNRAVHSTSTPVGDDKYGFVRINKHAMTERRDLLEADLAMLDAWIAEIREALFRLGETVKILIRPVRPGGVGRW